MKPISQAESEAFAMYPYNHGADHFAWAKRILYRESKGDNTLTALQVRFARMAMNIKPEAA